MNTNQALAAHRRYPPCALPWLQRRKDEPFFLKLSHMHTIPGSPELRELAPLITCSALTAGRAAASAYEEQGPQIRGKSASDN